MAKTRSRRFAVVAAAFAVLGLVAAVGFAAAASRTVVKVNEESALGHPVLTNDAGLTLYSLSVEKNGHFTCVGSCTKLWRPLTVAKGVKPTGPVRLGTVRRPDGRIQVTYSGRPLYRFGGDKQPGQANGEGFQDVGTWHAARPKGAASSESEQPSSEPSAPSNPYGY